MVKNGNYLNKFSEKNSGLKSIKKEENKIYKKKPLKISILKNKKNKENSNIINLNIIKEKKEYEKKEKNLFLY